VRRRGRLIPYNDVTRLANADEIVVAIDAHGRAQADQELSRFGFGASAPPPAPAVRSSSA
jgi:hypothetical protein